MNWLNGHYVQNGRIHIGTVSHCACCGVITGGFCAVIDDDDVLDDPVWPFREDDCPLCPRIGLDAAEEIAARSSIRTIQQALMIKRSKEKV